jgi:hypothetical protein
LPFVLAVGWHLDDGRWVMVGGRSITMGDSWPELSAHGRFAARSAGPR